ncbi:MAG TPA: glycoside hydrolase family 3 C-terminal domain-containing protein, partial [Opitutaceae bacterium]
ATDLLAVLLRAHAARKPEASYDEEAHHLLARRAAAEGIVLLKNDGLLPLKVAQTKQIAVIGAFAQSPRYQGSGSSRVNPTRLDNTLDQLRKLVGPGTSIDYVAGYAEDGSTDDASLENARRIAAATDVALVFAGLPESYESEGFDREHIDLPEGHNRLIRAVAAAQPRTAVVLLNGSAVAMPWVEEVPAIVEGWLGGQAGGGALADVLTGRVNPSGKLSETFPVRLADTPTYLNFPGLDGETRYGEGVFVGYRYYDAKAIEPLFPFGHGLSYTTFAYSDVAADSTSIDDTAGTQVRVTVKNTGARAGLEIVQLYVREQDARVRRPEKELRHFAKVSLAPGEEKTVTFRLERRDFAYWDTRIHQWAVKSGKFDVRIGSSSRDLPLSLTLDVHATQVVHPPLTRESLVKAFSEQPQARPVYEEIMLTAFKAFGIETSAAANGEGFKALEESNAMIAAFIRDMPAWKVVSMSRGQISDERLDELIAKAQRQP